jgi:nucleoside-diphosphate-sugar epimerase
MTSWNPDAKIVLVGGAGLVGQNLATLLIAKGHRHIVCLDKQITNLETLRHRHPDIITDCVDVAAPGAWEKHLEGSAALVMLQAQIGGLDYQEFVHNNVASSKCLLEAARKADVPYLVHISSSVVNSQADDFYNRTKKIQEALVAACDMPHCILRPTLMFGWFDRKHLGWLARFMRRQPVFPVPGDGRYIRQPLFVQDFCEIIHACLERRLTGIYDISGLEKVTYIDMIRQIRNVVGARARIVKIPYGLFWLLLRIYALFDRNPPFTTQQLAALVIPEEFPVIDWPGIFGVRMTPWRKALERTFREKPYCDVALEF